MRAALRDDYAARRRDKREPGRRRKEAREDELARLMRRHWRRQASALRDKLVPYLTTVRFDWVTDALMAEFGDDYWHLLNRDLVADLVRLLSAAAADGVSLFAETVNLGLDTAPVNTAAAEWAARYSYDLVRGLTDTARNSLRVALETFVRVPGTTIGDVMAALPFDEARALRVAVTEITRAYAEANKLAGDELVKQFPGVRVVKTWFTNRDDRVCPICGPLDGQTQDHAKPFVGGDGKDYDRPPAHVSCRCWDSVTTRITE